MEVLAFTSCLLDQRNDFLLRPARSAKDITIIDPRRCDCGAVGPEAIRRRGQERLIVFRKAGVSERLAGLVQTPKLLKDSFFVPGHLIRRWISPSCRKDNIRCLGTNAAHGGTEYHRMHDGLLILDKPAGITSAAALNRVKRLLPRGTKIGHAGTLDPFATGVLILLIGKATKCCEELMN